MAVHQTTRESLISGQIAQKKLVSYLTLAAVLLAMFLIASFHLTRESLWDDEGYTMAFIRDSAAPPESLRESLQFVASSLLNTLKQVRTVDVHPPLYYVTLDIWALVGGNSIYTVRLYSALWGLIALAATYAVGHRLFRDFVPSIMAVLVLGTASFFVYYAREARMYTLLMALTALSMWAYLRWCDQPTIRRALVYGVMMALLLYTHYAGAFVIAAQGIHLLLSGKVNHAPVKKLFWVIFPYFVILLLFVPWIPSALAQYRVHGGPGGLPLASDWNTISALLLLLTNGYGWLYGAVAIFALIQARRDPNKLSLIVLWLLLLPVALLVLNAAVRPLFQMRYVTPILPAFALLIAFGVRQLKSLHVALSVGVLGLILFIQLSTYSWFWPNKPAWDISVQHMTAERKLLEPAITSISEYSPAAYYDRLYGIRQGISLDLSWRWQESYDMVGYVESMRESPSVWVVMPSSFSSTWDAVMDLVAEGRGVGYRDTMMNMIFYRFDQNRGDNLNFRFGDALTWKGGIGHQLYARAGDSFCFDLNFEALQAIDAHYSVDVALTQGYNTRRAGQQMALSDFDAGSDVHLSPCIDVPTDNPPGPHHLRVRVLHDGKPLMLLENDNLYWSEELMPALVSIDAVNEESGEREQ